MSSFVSVRIHGLFLLSYLLRVMPVRADWQKGKKDWYRKNR